MIEDIKYNKYNKGKDNPMFGKIPWNKGKKMPHNIEWEKNRLEKIHLANMNRVYKKGWKHTLESKEKMRMKAIKYAIENHDKVKEQILKYRKKNLSGSNNPNWKGGVTLQYKYIRVSDAYKKWHKEVLRKDNFMCTWCYSKKNLEVHHIYPLKLIIKNKKYDWLWDIHNGLTLCKECHKKTESYKKNNLEKFIYTPDIRNLKFEVWDTMRYDSCGDYFNDGTIVVSSQLSFVDRIGIAIHELTEFIILSYNGIPASQIDEYDMKKGGEYYGGMYDEDKRYKHAHQIATRIEKLLMKELGEDWKAYDRRVMDVKIHWTAKKPKSPSR